MATKPKPVGRKLKDREVATALHDELLIWLVDNLANVCNSLLSMPIPRWHEEVGKAKADSVRWLESNAVPSLSEFASGAAQPYGWVADEEPELSEECKKALMDAISYLPSAIKLHEAFEANDDLRYVTLGKHQVMAPVELPGSRNPVEGYVDLVVLARYPVEVEIGLKHFPSRFAYSTPLDSYRFESDPFGYASDDDFLQIARALLEPELELRTNDREIELWCTVRTDPFTLGEILQELKTIRSLGSRDRFACLVTQSVAPQIRKHIEHEGFLVVERQRFTL